MNNRLATHLHVWIAFFCVASFFIALGPKVVFADPQIFVRQNLDFGRVIPRTSTVTISLDAMKSGNPACIPSNTCEVSGGHPAELVFIGFGSLNIRLGFPADVKLSTSSGRRGGILRRMHMLSNVIPFVDGDSLKAYIGGELVTGSPVYGEKLTGTVNVEITTY